MNKVTILKGHVLDRLRDVPSNVVHCVVTSPPYFGLRDYQCRGQIGLEKTLEEYIEIMVQVFREVRRVMRPDATLWLNLGDTYAASRSYQVPDNKHPACGEHDKGSHKVPPGLKQKDLCGIPWRVALALQSDGWWLRSDIIWAKPNPMPESVTDRPTRAHEYIFLLTKSGKYFWDQGAVRENSQANEASQIRASYGRYDAANGQAKRNYRTGKPDYLQAIGNDYGGCTRNLRSVWNIATAPFPEAHFATFPSALVEKCIAAGTSEKGVCPKCGAPWVRVVEKKAMIKKRSFREDNIPTVRNEISGTMIEPARTTTLGWQPSCKCGGDPTPATVLDPFSGSGTTCLVAAKMGRDSIGIELKPEYVEMAKKRIRKEMGFLISLDTQSDL